MQEAFGVNLDTDFCIGLDSVETVDDVAVTVLDIALDGAVAVGYASRARNAP